MWTVVYLARSREVAEKLQQLLEQGGLLVKLRPLNKESEEGGSYDVLVPESEVEQAHSLIIDSDF